MSAVGRGSRDSEGEVRALKGPPAAADGGRLDSNPSSWQHRLPVLVLVLAGLAVASDLTLVQLGALAAWDPLFGDGTRRVLFSGLARSLPVPDAALGAAAYALEALLVLPGGSDRWATRPHLALGFGLLTLAMALGGLVLVLAQAFVIGSFCTLCLASAAISWTAAALDLPELRAAIRRLRNGEQGAPPSSARRSATAPGRHP